ncbi:hypothetical protein ACWC5I_15745, partial [Kitasatospora sp. NPDC001574]
MRTRHTEQPPFPDAGADADADTHAHADAGTGGGTEQDALELRAELDELLRARQYAGQRERRLFEAVRALPERQHPDGELTRQLAQARTLREGLAARCLELSDQLKILEDHLRQPAPRLRMPRQPTGARFGGGAYDEASAPSMSPAPPPPRATGARFGRFTAQAQKAKGPTDPTGPAGPTGPTRPAEQAGPAGAVPGPAATTSPPPPPPAAEPPRRRSPGELTTLADRIIGLYQQATGGHAPQQATHHHAPPRQAASREAARVREAMGPDDAADQRTEQPGAEAR